LAETNDKREIVQRFLEAQRRRRPLTMMRLTTPDMLLKFPDSSPTIGGPDHRGRRAAVRAMARVLWITRWSLAITPQSIDNDGDSVRSRTTATAHRGGKQLDLPLDMTFRFRDGRICAIEESTPDLDRWHQFWD
jgi:ketosteroid isomerase-like protein